MSSWKSAEELVAAIEKSLAPDAVVEHDVHLPVLGQNRSRQCDVIIRIGKAPREQFFIVEVQQRGTKPDINTFGGWLRKMDEVGANGLICVSEAGFPQSIIDDVALRVGPKVRLMTLERDESELSFGSGFLVPELVRSSVKIKILEAATFEFWETPTHDLTADFGGAILSHSGIQSEAFTLKDAATQAVMERDPTANLPRSALGHPIFATYNLLASETLPLWVHAKEGTFRLRKVTIKVEVRRIEKSEPMVYSKWNYRQQFHGSALAWVATASFEVGGEPMKATLIFAPDENGYLRPSMVLEPSSEA